MKTVRPLARRAHEELADGRRWSFGEPEFSTAISLVHVTPSELDVLELGMRSARSYAEEFTHDLQSRMYREARMVHPVEHRKDA